MCTVSWTWRRGGYDLFFNRDELNLRAPESPPTVGTRTGVAYLAPRDGGHGGTWLMANDSGMTICLLNDYGSSWRPDPSRPRHSRGHVVLAGTAAANHADVLAAVEAQPLATTPAFHLVALSQEEGALIVNWQGRQLAERMAPGAVGVLSSSSFATHEVIAQRLRLFPSFGGEFGRAAAEKLAVFHRQHTHAAGAESVLMRRSDAATRSLIHVTVDAEEVWVDYHEVDRVPEIPLLRPPLRTGLRLRSRTTSAA